MTEAHKLDAKEARCPECDQWGAVSYEVYLAPTDYAEDGSVVFDEVAGPWWWVDTPGCPNCGALVMVESECEFRRAFPAAPHTEQGAPQS